PVRVDNASQIRGQRTVSLAVWSAAWLLPEMVGIGLVLARGCFASTQILPRHENSSRFRLAPTMAPGTLKRCSWMVPVCYGSALRTAFSNWQAKAMRYAGP